MEKYCTITIKRYPFLNVFIGCTILLKLKKNSSIVLYCLYSIYLIKSVMMSTFHWARFDCISFLTALSSGRKGHFWGRMDTWHCWSKFGKYIFTLNIFCLRCSFLYICKFVMKKILSSSENVFSLQQLVIYQHFSLLSYVHMYMQSRNLTVIIWNNYLIS